MLRARTITNMSRCWCPANRVCYIHTCHVGVGPGYSTLATFTWTKNVANNTNLVLYAGMRSGVLIFVGLILRLRVKVGHRLLNFCDCDSVLSERRRQTHSQDLKNNNSILLRSYLNLISVIACSKTVHLWFGLLHPIHILLYSVRLWKQVRPRPVRSPLFW